MPYDNYYTFNQFYSIMTYMGLIMLICVSTMYFYYSLDKKKVLIISASLYGLFSLLTSFIARLTASFVAYRIFFLMAYILRLIHIFICIYLLYYLVNNKERQSKNKNIYLIIFYIISLPLCFLNINPYLALDSFIIIHYMILLDYFIEYRFSRTMFLEVSENLQNYVFVLDSKGDLIYTNNLVKKTKYFADNINFDLSDIASFFNCQIKIRKGYDKTFIKTVEDESVYFYYTIKQIYSDKGKSVVVVTFLDFTGIVELLDELKNRKDTVNKANQRLLKYKDRVYDLEKRREIYNLLDKISEEHNVSMQKLKQEIEKLDVADSEFITKISAVITSAKYDLKNVRELVSFYRNV